MTGHNGQQTGSTRQRRGPEVWLQVIGLVMLLWGGLALLVAASIQAGVMAIVGAVLLAAGLVIRATRN